MTSHFVMLCEQSSAGIERRAVVPRSSIGTVQLRERAGTTPTQYSCTREPLNRLVRQPGLHATPRCRCRGINRDVKVCLRNKRLRMRRQCREKRTPFPIPPEWKLIARWVARENFMRERRTPSVVASESAISALIDYNLACNYCARFERTRRPSENFRSNFCEDDEVILRCINVPRKPRQMGMWTNSLMWKN